MANCCMYTIKATGKMEDVKEFVRMLKWKGTPPNEGFGRIMSAYVSCEEPLEEGLFSCEVEGDCAWSIRSSMLNIDGKRNPSLETETKRLNLAVEAYSQESGCCFQEHFLIVKGEILTNECLDWYEYNIEDLDGEDLQETCATHHITEEALREKADANDGWISFGGFGACYNSFSDLTSYF